MLMYVLLYYTPIFKTKKTNLQLATTKSSEAKLEERIVPTNLPDIPIQLPENLPHLSPPDVLLEIVPNGNSELNSVENVSVEEFAVSE